MGTVALGMLYKWEKSVLIKLQNTMCSDFLLPDTSLAFLNHSNIEYQLIALKSLIKIKTYPDESFLEGGGIQIILNLVKSASGLVQETALCALLVLVRYNIDVQNLVVVAQDLPQRLVEIMSFESLETDFWHRDEVLVAAAKLMLALCGKNNAVGLAAVRDVGGLAAAMNFASCRSLSQSSWESIAELFADIREETPSIQEDLEKYHVVESLLELIKSRDCCRNPEEYHIPALTAIAWDSPATCQVILREGGVPLILDAFNFYSDGYEVEDADLPAVPKLTTALATTDWDCWLALCDAGAIPLLARTLEVMEKNDEVDENFVAALCALSSRFFEDMVILDE